MRARRTPRTSILVLAPVLAGAFPGCGLIGRGELARELAGARERTSRTEADDLSRRPPRRGPDDRELEDELARAPSRDAVREAVLVRNPDVEAALERWSAFLERVPQRLAPPNPMAAYRYSSMFKMHEVGIVFGVPFPTKLLADSRVALGEARAARADYAERVNVLRAQAEIAYATLYLARRELEIIERNVVVLGHLVEVARAQQAAGKAMLADVLKVEVDRDALRAQRAAAAANVRTAASALNVLLDRRPDAPLGPLAPLPEPGPPGAFEALATRALEERPELAGARERARAADRSVSRATQEWIPDLEVGAAYVRDFGMDRNEVDLTAGISLPIFFGAIRARIREAEAEARRSRAEARSARNRVLDEVRAGTAQVEASAERYSILGGALVRANHAFHAAEAAYTAARLDFLALLDSWRALLARELEREGALAEHAIRRAELERAVGAFAPRPER